MDTHFTFSSDKFRPTPSELNENHEDFINDGFFAKELAKYLETKLIERRYSVKFRCAEDWGQWLELEHDGKYTLAIGCSNASSLQNGFAYHHVFISPDKPVIKKMFRRIDIGDEICALSHALRGILMNDPKIVDVEVESFQNSAA